MEMKRFIRSLFRFRGNPHKVAVAFALGIALGVIPGTGAFVAAGVATVLRLNLPVMVAGALITNPVTSPFIYTGSYALGRWLLGDWLPTSRVGKILLGTVAGNMVLALLMAAAGYLIIWGLIHRVRVRLRNRRLARHAAAGD